MKFNSSILTLLVAALSAGASWGQLPVSPTSGIIQTALTANKSNLVAIPFPKSIPFEGTVASVAGAVITVSGVSLPTLANHSIYIATDVDPSDATGAYGRVLRILSNTANTVTVEASITPEAGDEFQILEQYTLETLLGTGAQASVQVLTAGSSGLSDIVYVESAGVFTGYWHHVNIGWKTLAGTLAPNVAIPFGKGLLINRKGGAARTLRVQGEALTGRFRAQTTASPAQNVVNNPFLVETALIEAGLGVNTTSATSGLADLVYLEDAGTISGYWRKNNGNWYPISDATGSGPAITNAVKIKPGKALLITDRNPNGVAIPQPFNE